MKGRLMDCHVHLDEIAVHNPLVAKYFEKQVGESRWKGATIEQVLRHIQKDNLDLIFAIYENPEKILTLRKASPHCDIRAMLFIRDIKNIDEQHLQNLYQNGLLQGIKLHPVIDYYELTADNLSGVLKIAEKFNLPILYHCDDRREFMHLTAPTLQEKLIKGNPGIRFIIGHGGAYVHPRLCGNGGPAKGYWNSGMTPYSRATLIASALNLTARYNNAYYDVTVATNPIKASLIVEFLQKNPTVAEKVLIGTDFPINFSSAQTQLNSLEKAGLKKSLLEKIASNRLV